MATNFSDTSMAPGREYFPPSPNGFESYIIRNWRRSIRDRHMVAEGL